MEELQQLHSAKLYHQLTVRVLELISTPEWRQGTKILDLYLNFISQFSSKLNPLSLAQIISAASEQLSSAKECLQFIQQSLTKHFPDDLDHGEARLYLRSLGTLYQIQLCNKQIWKESIPPSDLKTFLTFMSTNSDNDPVIAELSKSFASTISDPLDISTILDVESEYAIPYTQDAEFYFNNDVSITEIQAVTPNFDFNQFIDPNTNGLIQDEYFSELEAALSKTQTDEQHKASIDEMLPPTVNIHDPVTDLQTAQEMIQHIPLPKELVRDLKAIQNLFNHPKIRTLTPESKYDAALNMLQDCSADFSQRVTLAPKVAAMYHKAWASYYSNTGNYRQYFEHQLSRLNHEVVSTLSPEEQISVSLELAHACLFGENVFNVGEYLHHDIGQVLLNTPDSFLISLLHTFSTGDAKKFDEIISQNADYLANHSDFAENLPLSKAKMRILAFVELAFHRKIDEKIIPFATVSKNCDVNPKDVVDLLVNVIDSGLVDGRIDEHAGHFHLYEIKPRFLNQIQLKSLRNKLASWRTNAKTILSVMETIYSS